MVLILFHHVRREFYGGGGGCFWDLIGPFAAQLGAWWERALVGQTGIAGEILAKSFLNSLGCNFGEILTLVGSCADG